MARIDCVNDGWFKDMAYFSMEVAGFARRVEGDNRLDEDGGRASDD